MCRTVEAVFDEQVLHFLWHFDGQNRHNADGLFLWALSVSRFVILEKVFFGGNSLIKGILFFNGGGGNLFVDKYFGGGGGGGGGKGGGRYRLFNTL